jgi:hypothetical protein
MTEREIIERGYQERVLVVFKTFSQAYLEAQDANGRQQAEQNFRRGIEVARDLRDRALALLP